MSVTWTVKPGSDLAAKELYDLLQLRIEIFTVEQDCPYQDLDGQDLLDNIYHIQGFASEEEAKSRRVNAYLRVMYNGEDKTEARIGRVVVRESERSTGLGRKLMNKALETINELQPKHPVKSVMLHGQSHLQKWYESFGFEVHGEPFLEDGIPHLVLIKKLGP